MADIRLKHTPGPWIVGRGGHTVFAFPDDRQREDCVCSLEGFEECHAANARVIAAAPRLLEALKFAAAGFAVIANDKTAAQHSRDFARDNFDQANAAIAEAEGRK